MWSAELLEVKIAGMRGHGHSLVLSAQNLPLFSATLFSGESLIPGALPLSGL